MKTLIISLLISHVAAGTLSLLTGLTAMLVHKGGKIHNRAGLVYVWCMIYVAVSAVLLFVLQPYTIFRLFLTGIAVFSFYLSFTGWRATKQKKTGPTPADHWLTYVTLAVSVGMVACGLFLITKGASFMSILFTFFGILTFVFAARDYRIIGKPQVKMHWFFQHFTRMAASYIAAFTAFMVNNNARLLPAHTPDWVFIAGWIAPSIIGGLLIRRTVRAYKARFKLA
jgi:uncharacterized membrane protein